MATMVVSLMQKDTRVKRSQNWGEPAEEFIQFRVFKVKDGVEDDGTALKYYSSELDRVGTSGNYINKREVTKRFRVPPGDYVIMPSTYDENHECKFLLRVFTEQPVEAE
jgi:calpain, invertebrate